MSHGMIGSVLRVVCATIPFVLLCLRSAKINLPRSQRGHQFLLPLAAVVFCIPVMLTVDRIALQLIRLVGFVSGLAGMIPGIGGLLRRALEGASSTLHGGYGVQLLCNTAIMTAFCCMKEILLPIVRRWWSRWRGLYDWTAGVFYEQEEGKLRLRQCYAHMRQLFLVMYIASIVLGVVNCVLVYLFTNSEVFHFPSYPVFAVIVLGEINFFLDGYTVDEAIEGGEEDSDEPVCAKLMEALRERFHDRLLMSGEVPATALQPEKHNWEEELREGDHLDRIAGAFFAKAAEDDERLIADYVTASRKLLHRKSVLIYNPFYHDLTTYLILPIFHELLNHRKCLVVCGRMTDQNDIEQWLRSGIQDTTNLPKLWKIKELVPSSSSDQQPDVGILHFTRLYDLANLRDNQDFLRQVGLVILLEPSNLLGTGQIGLRNIVQHCEQSGEEITYCILDRNADGLVDALSHALRQSITEVFASPIPHSKYCRAFWRAEGPGVQNRILPTISHYLGFGGEISALAMHEGAENLHWFSGSKMPLTDLKWNMEQYYAPVCNYIHVPAEQSELDNRLHFHNNLWQGKSEQDAYVMVEDEFCNAFEMSRTYAARIQKRGFVNILSESYLLRDYMCDNPELFTNDPKAIPSIVPDYARTERNFVLRTLMIMGMEQIDERRLIDEFALYGIETKDPYSKLCALIKKHTGIDNPRVKTTRETVLVGGCRFSRFSYSIDQSQVDQMIHSALKTAYFVVEDEKREIYPMGNRLMGHMEQVMLPGQFFCYDGKYYQVRSISPESGIIVRRAADHLNGRVYYRQLRQYKMAVEEWSDHIRDLRGITVRSCSTSCQVTTRGYLEQKAAHLLPNATLVRMDQPYVRSMRLKDTLAIQLPDAEPEVCFTLCVLLNELFATIYPNERGYLSAATACLPEGLTEDPEYDCRISALVPKLSLSDTDGRTIFLIEDSSIDLGLLVSAERNLQRLLEILTDYLDWYLDPKRKETAASDDEEKTEEETPPEEEDASASVAASETAESDVDGEDEEAQATDGSQEYKYEAAVDYLTFGYGDTPSWLALKKTLDYLNAHNFGDSSLQRARKREPSFDDGSQYDPSQPGTHYCDFCGSVLVKGHYRVLKDGRERCEACGKDAIKTRRAFKRVYQETLREMEQVFSIQIDVPIKVRMVNAKKVNDIPGHSFTPTPGFDMRVLGYAQNHPKGYRLMVENGAPKWKMKSTLVHELTHIWQFATWDNGKLERKYPGSEDRLLVMEGMAVWAEVQYLLSMGEKERAVMYKRNRDADPSVYGVGMKRFLQKYPPIEKASIPTKETPFGIFPPL